MIVMVNVECPSCGADNERRESLREVVPGCVIAPQPIIWCRICRTEIPGPEEVAE
jgi:hypothetical protein